MLSQLFVSLFFSVLLHHNWEAVHSSQTQEEEVESKEQMLFLLSTDWSIPNIVSFTRFIVHQPGKAREGNQLRETEDYTLPPFQQLTT